MRQDADKGITKRVGLSPVCDVEVNAGPAGDRPGVVGDGVAAGQHGVAPAVRSVNLVLVVPTPAGRDGVEPVAPGRRGRLGRKRIHPAEVARLIQRHAEEGTERWAHIAHPPIGLGNPDTEWDRFADRLSLAAKLGKSREGLFAVLALGDLDDAGGETHRRACGVPQRHRAKEPGRGLRHGRGTPVDFRVADCLPGLHDAAQQLHRFDA